MSTRSEMRFHLVRAAHVSFQYVRRHPVWTSIAPASRSARGARL